MASAIPGTSISRPERSLSSSSSERSISPGHSSPGARRQHSISFVEDTLSTGYSSSTAPNDRSDPQTSSRTDNTASPSSQNNGRSQTGLPKPSPSSEPSSSSSSHDLKQPWYARLLSNYRSISLENKGSVARDHLALERTFLAWLRTSLAFASIGIAITQLFRLNTSLADQKQARRRTLGGLNTQDGGGSLPLSPLMGASLTPDLYSNIQSALLQQTYPIFSPSDNTASSLLEQLINPTAFDSDAAAKLRHLGKPLGATFLGISIVILFIGFHRYFESQHWIIRGQFPASRGSVAITGLIAVALIVASLVVVLVVAPSAYNKK
jgi:uncharacterized membrane protein YidH (DUF202 family)